MARLTPILFAALVLAALLPLRARAVPAVSFGAPTVYPTAAGADNIITADIDGDGNLDLIYGDANGVEILWGNGDGTFTGPTTVSVPNSISALAVGDFETNNLHPLGDKVLDIAAASGSGSAVYIITNDGNRQLSYTAGYSVGTNPYGVCVGDFKGNGYLDIATSNNNDDDVSVLINKADGSGTFDNAVNYGAGSDPSRIACADLTGSGVLDLVCANAGDGTFSVFMGNGDGTFQSGAVTRTTSDDVQVLIDDFTGNNILDLETDSTFGSEVGVSPGNGNGTFGSVITSSAGTWPHLSEPADFLGRGVLDLAVPHLSQGAFSVMMGNGDGSFQPPVDFQTGGSNSRTVAVGDFNGDGHPDVAVADATADQIAVFLNNTVLDTLTKMLTTFNDQGVTGLAPPSPLILGSDGNYYGAAAGQIYKITPSGAVTILYDLAASDDDLQCNFLTEGSDGNFYGVSTTGGSANFGAVFEMTPAGVLTVLHNFGDGTVDNDGDSPSCALVEYSGVLYGATSGGGASMTTDLYPPGFGTLYQIAVATGDYQSDHSFVATPGQETDGQVPDGQLAVGIDGTVWGTTKYGGATATTSSSPSGDGTVFTYTASQGETVFNSFGTPADAGAGAHPDGVTIGFGFYPVTRLAGAKAARADRNGRAIGTNYGLYGVTPGDAAHAPFPTSAGGCLFEIENSGAFTVLHNFGDGSVASDGVDPQGAPMLADNGVAYGVTADGGVNGGGVLYAYDPNEGYRIVHTFGDNGIPGEGTQNVAPPIEGADNSLYGVSVNGGAARDGAVYKIALETTPFVFTGDGESDILWWNSKSGQALVWDMDGMAVTYDGTPFTQVADTSWRIVGLPDITGSGTPDLLWWNASTGQLLVWTMGGSTGTTVIHYGSPFAQVAPGTGWQPAAVGDNFNGMWSLWWRNVKNGDILRWRMDGASVSQYGGVVATVPVQWQIVGAPDLTGAGHTGQLWWNSSTGQVLFWTMNDTTVVHYGTAFAQVADPSWQLVGAPDLYGTGQPCLLWWNSTTGQILAWTTDGASITGYGSPFATVDPSTGWQPAGEK